MKRAGLAVTLVAAAAVLAAMATAAPALAARTAGIPPPPPECIGLTACVPVAGPWVKIPAVQAGGSGGEAEWELACPGARYLIGGVAARVSDGAVAVTFDGLAGSPVGSGLTTRSAALFRATYTGDATVATSFRPALGCVPTKGGGARSRVSSTATLPPLEKLNQHLVERPLTAGRPLRVVATCGAGGRLVHSSFAVAFATAQPPGPGLLAAVSAAGVRRGATLVVQAAATQALPATVKVVLQVRTVCTQGFQ